jgi:hypothetical protein
LQLSTLARLGRKAARPRQVLETSCRGPDSRPAGGAGRDDRFPCPDADLTLCPRWRVGRNGELHDVDDLSVFFGAHHDRAAITADLAGDGGSRIYVKPSGSFRPRRNRGRLGSKWTPTWRRSVTGAGTIRLVGVADTTATERASTVAAIWAGGLNYPSSFIATLTGAAKR